jgi:hypothetical protein
MWRKILWPRSLREALSFSVIAGRVLFYAFMALACSFAVMGFVAARNAGGSLLQRLTIGAIGFLLPAAIGRLSRLIIAGE